MLKDRSYHTLPREDKPLALFGVPVLYLKKPIALEQFNFAPTSISYSVKDVVVIQTEYQRNFICDVMSNIAYFGEPTTYAIGSYPTDQASYQLAALLTKTYYTYLTQNRLYPRIKWIDLGSPDWDFLKLEDSSCNLLVIHGLSEASSENRKFELAKDFYRKATYATKIVLAVTPNILSFVTNKLEMSPDAVFQLTKTTNRVVV